MKRARVGIAPVSVLMPARNAARTINLAVLSTLLSLGPRDELLVGLHNCSDDSESILARIHDPRLKVHKLTGGGLAEVLNALLAAAINPLVARMDADDVCLPWRFPVQKRFMKTNESLDFVFSTALILSHKGFLPVCMPQAPVALNSCEISYLLAEKATVMHPTFFGKTSSLLALGGYIPYPTEDWHLWLRASISGKKMHRLGVPTIIYRMSSSQYTQTNATHIRESSLDLDFQRMRQLSRANTAERCNPQKIRWRNVKIEERGLLGWVKGWLERRPS